MILLLLVQACASENKLEAEIAKTDIQLRLSRFDLMLSDASANSLAQLKEAFPFFFSEEVPDSVWIQKFEDPIQQELIREVKIAFEDFSTAEAEIEDFYRHLKFYKPAFQVPEVITLINDVDYRNKVIVTDSLALIALDNYLGEDHPFYQNISKFIAADMRADQIVSDLAEVYAEKTIPQFPRRTFLDEMVYQGKLMYYKDVMIPFKSDASKIGYTEQELDWATANEASIWSYFIEKELLYSTDLKLNGRFINPAPYSKFYLELDNESPGQLGVYIGWQIVRAYALSSGETLDEIMQKPAEELFKASKFKPRK